MRKRIIPVGLDGAPKSRDCLLAGANTLGAEYDWHATPGLAEVNEFYSMARVERLRDVLPNFTCGHTLIGVCGAPYKCPPAPSERAAPRSRGHIKDVFDPSAR